MKVLVTGAAGFIGNRIVAYCREQKYNVVGWDLLDNSFVHSVNMIDQATLMDELSNLHPDIIVHCAGNADVRKSVSDPYEDFNGNVRITHNLLFSLHKLGFDSTKLLFLSSAGVYGNPISLPITEEMTLNPLSPYALHKVMCEKLCEYFIHNYDMDIRIARIFSAYGEGLRKQIFWDMNVKYKKNGRLDMFGTGYESRDYIHVEDVVKALFLIITSNTDDRVFNVANGEEITIKEATEIFAEHMGINKEKIVFNNIVREGDPLNWKADISRIKKLGYSKSVSICDGLERYVKWVKDGNEY